MIANFSGQDYMVILDKDSGELSQLTMGNTPETKLIFLFDEKDLGKSVSLKLENNNAIDGIELTFLPQSIIDWESIQKIQKKINETALRYVKERGRFGTRYNGSDKVEIYGFNPFTS